MMKRIISILTVGIALAMSGLPVYADTGDNMPEQEKTGTLYLEYSDDEAVTGAVFNAYKVAEFDDAHGYVSVVGGVENIEKWRDDPDGLLETVQDEYADDPDSLTVYHTETDREGHAVITGMEQGLYIVAETKPADGFYSSTSFYAELPFTQDGQWVYSIVARPKPQPMPELPPDTGDHYPAYLYGIGAAAGVICALCLAIRIKRIRHA